MKSKKIFFFLLALAVTTMSYSQALKPIAKKITDQLTEGKNFTPVNLFTISPSSLQRSNDQQVVADATMLNFNSIQAQGIMASSPENIRMTIPVNAGPPLELFLYKADIFTPDFRVTTSGNNGNAVAYSGGVHYWGIVSGDNNSLASISIFNNEVMGIITSPSSGNLVLGKIENDPASMHVLYNDKNLPAAPSTACYTAEDDLHYKSKDLQASNKMPSNCIRLFWEVNFDLYTNKTTISNTVNYVTGIFSQSAIIYTNDSIPVELSEVFVWNTASPYTATSTSALLGQFQSNRNSFNGDLGHLIGLAGGGGIAAGFSGLCNGNLDNSQCYSGVNTSYNNFPTYSWSVMVVTHEQGHLMGSRHTHACVWNGNMTAIDNCGPTAGYGYEGVCSNAPTPVGGGTIMSYCHLVGGVGINLSNGFGTQPKNVIKNNYNNALCLTSCTGNTCMPSANMSTANITSTSATFQWAAVTGAISYNIRYRQVGTGTWFTDTTSLTFYNKTGLTNGLNYEWQVQTVCAGGNSIFTISTNFTTTPVNCLVPGSLSTTSIQSTSAVFSWGAVAGASSYNVRYRIVGNPTWLTGTSATTSYNASGLTANSNYEWQVQTVCTGGGQSAFTPSALFSTSPPPCNTPANNFTNGITSTNAQFNWGGSAIYFNIRYRIVGTVPWNNIVDTLSPLNLFSLTPFTNYEWQIQAVCQQGSSSFSNSVNFATLCSIPFNGVGPVGPTTFCSGGSVLLTANTGLSYTYQWLVNGGPIPGQTAVNYLATTSGAYAVTIFQGTCSSTSSPLQVTVNPLPTVSTGGDVAVCQGTPAVLTGNPAGGNFSVANPYSGPTTMYTYSYTDSNGCSNTTPPDSITVNPLPLVSFSGLAANYTTASPSATLTGSPTGGIFSGAGITGNVFDPAAAGVGGPYNITYSYTDANGCSNTSVQQTTVTSCTAPAQPGTITQVGGTTKICPGDSKTYKIALVSGATSYTWTPPAGGVISSGQGTKQVVVDYNAGFTASGNLSVTANNTCGSSQPRTKPITRNTPAKPSAITGQSAGLCLTSGVPFNVTAVNGMVYNWSFITANATVASGQGNAAITADFSPGFTTDSLRVTASNGCGVSPARALYVKAVPATPGTITGAAGVCISQAGVPYSIVPVPGAVTYTWSGPNGSRFSDGVVTSLTAMFTTTSASVTVNFATTAGNIKVKANTSCGSSSFKSKAVSFVCREGGVFSGLNLTAFPNPNASENMTIQFNSPEPAPYSLRLTDLAGRILIKLEGTSGAGMNESVMDLSMLTGGVYLLQLTNGADVATSKVIIE